ncbi:MAG: ABC transporter permease [Bacteroidetes bacterium]|nr:MAG: ABC transporter permease [Bacteroidota bacterium]
MIFKLAWRNLWRNKRRTLITAASVFFAVLLAVLMRSFQEGSYDLMIKNVVSFYTGYAQVHKKGYWDDQSLENSFGHAREVEQQVLAHPHVVEVVPRLESFALAAHKDLTEGCMVVGTDPEAEHHLSGLKDKAFKEKHLLPDPEAPDSVREEYVYDPAYYLRADDEAVLLAEGLAEKLELGVGDTLVLIGQGYQGVTAAGKYAVKGLVKFGSPDLNKRLVYMPLKLAQQLYAAPDRLTSLALVIDQPQQSTQIVQELRQQLDGEYEVMDWKEMMPELVQSIEADRGGGIITMLILYMIIGFGIFGTVLMMTAERQYEFGVMIAIGMKKWRLATIVVLETVLIAILGVLAGSLAGLPVVAYFNKHPIYWASMEKMYEEFGMEPIMPTALKLSIFSEQTMLVLLIVMVVCTYPFWKIQRTNPIEAMRR